ALPTVMVVAPAAPASWSLDTATDTLSEPSSVPFTDLLTTMGAPAATVPSGTVTCAWPPKLRPGAAAKVTLTLVSGTGSGLTRLALTVSEPPTVVLCEGVTVRSTSGSCSCVRPKSANRSPAAGTSTPSEAWNC